MGLTGKCALERDPAVCEHLVEVEEPDAGLDSTAVGAPVVFGAPVLEQPSASTPFPPSRSLGLTAISELMASRYVSVIGIFGDPDSGKTSCLVSLYLLLASGRLKGWTFADSKSLMAFEEIARGAREWNEGNPSDQMTMHTELADERSPGFLHLRLKQEETERCVDLALPDLPGEWTTELIGKARTDRFEFLKTAEVLWIVVDGRSLADKERRQGLISRVGQLVARIKTLYEGNVPRVIVVATHRDGGVLEESVRNRLKAELDKRELAATILEVAPFSEADEIAPGFGIRELLDLSVATKLAAPKFWTDTGD